MTNEALCRAYQAGDAAAAAQLVEANHPFIRAIALTYAQRFPDLWLDADDFMQEGAIAFLRAAEHYSPASDASFLTYAGVAAWNGIQAAIRSACPERTWAAIEEAAEAASPSLNPEGMMIEKERRQQLHTAIACLSKREVAWLRARYGLYDNDPLPMAEAARQFQISISRAQRLEKQALARLKYHYLHQPPHHGGNT